MAAVTRHILIAGLILLAAFLPLAWMPLAIVSVAPVHYTIHVPQFAGSDAQPVALLALTLLRAPPSL